MLYKTTGHQVAHTTSLQTSIIAGLSFSPPSLVANYTSFNKAATDPGLASLLLSEEPPVVSMSFRGVREQRNLTWMNSTSGDQKSSVVLVIMHVL